MTYPTPLYDRTGPASLLDYPQRIQRKRLKGWKMPSGAIYVGRPTVWGNPFWHVARFYGVERSLELYKDMVVGCWSPSLVDDLPDFYVQQIMAIRDEWYERLKWTCPLESALHHLRGRDLACWCRLDKQCHADVLLEIANK